MNHEWHMAIPELTVGTIQCLQQQVEWGSFQSVVEAGCTSLSAESTRPEGLVTMAFGFEYERSPAWAIQCNLCQCDKVHVLITEVSTETTWRCPDDIVEAVVVGTEEAMNQLLKDVFMDVMIERRQN